MEIPDVQKQAQEDNFDPDKPMETVCKKGDIWKLGNHRLMCGDSTDAGDVALLMNGEKATLFLTDPPYGVSYGDKNRFLNTLAKGNSIQKPIENDHHSEDEMFEIWKKAFSNANEVTEGCMSYYVFGAQGGELLLLLLALKESNLAPRHGLVWVKNNHVLGRSDYNYKHEPITYGWKTDGTHHFYGGFKTSVFEYDKPQKSDLHPTMKPVPLISELIINSSRDGEIVLDLFGGSGTTLIAAEQLNRKCYMMELDPHYCDVIIARWEKLTNQKAERITT
jgi:site-specific DNA-methyltransferase (adenine-specific)